MATVYMPDGLGVLDLGDVTLRQITEPALPTARWPVGRTAQ
jgi:hypothetical protein